MINKFKKILSLTICAVILIAACVTVLPADVYAWEDNVISETLNIAEANKNKSGPGYYWANRTNELTLSGVNIYTDSSYGLRLPKDCTVILEGDNYIRAEKYGISCAGTVVFKGNGTLTIDAGQIGVYLISQNDTHKVRFIEGKYTVSAGEYGIYSEAADFSFVGDSISINMKNDAGYAISGKCVNLVGGSFASNAPVTAFRELVVDSVDLDINASTTALSSPNLKIENVDIIGGEEYNGQTSVKTKALARFHAKSIILGENYPGWIDYVILVAVAAVVACAIVLPVLHKKKKNKKLYERLKIEGYIEKK